MKHCPKCDTVKPVADFYRDRRTKDGRYSCCKACHREHYIKKPPAKEHDRKCNPPPYRARAAADWRERWFLMTGIRPR